MRLTSPILAALATSTSVVLAQTNGNSTGPIVDLGYAKYKGNASLAADYNTNVFYGIHYAQAPVGELRWRAPQIIEAHNDFSQNDVLNAESVGPMCVQGTPKWRPPQLNTTEPIPVAGEEDCLRLDVYTPTEPESASLPVLLMIHGGGYTQGNSYRVPGEALVNASAGSMIYVSIQYRLGAFGFLSSSDIKEDGQANVGLLDQRSALEWVQRNIRAFGGDPARVTIWGGSAGGGSVTSQMIMYGGVSSPPFRAAIAEYPWWQPYHDNTILNSQYRDLLSASSCSNLQCLRSLNSSALQIASQQTYIDGYAAQPGYGYGYGDFYYGPSVDGDVLRDLPSNEFKQGHFTKVPFMTDREGYEGYGFSNQSLSTPSDLTTDLQTLFPAATPSFLDRLYQLYPSAAYNSTFFRRSALFGDFIINCPTNYMSSALSDAGQPTYKLLFNAGSQLHAATGPLMQQSNESPAVNNATLAQWMKEWFISFTTDLDPSARSFASGPQKPAWPVYNAVLGTEGGVPEFAVMSVNYTQAGVIGDLDVSAQCDFFHGASYTVRN